MNNCKFATVNILSVSAIADNTFTYFSCLAYEQDCLII
jgi:hypothetical protein